MRLDLRLAFGVIVASMAMPYAAQATGHELEAREASVAQDMHGHLSRIRAIKAFIIAGQLDGLREPAFWLAEHETAPGLPGDWQPYVADMRRYARDAGLARHVVFAAKSVSEMARTCGECHKAHAVSIPFGDQLRPPNHADGTRAQMQQHLWAADRMYEGLIGPSDLAWRQGTEILAEFPLSAADIIAVPEQEPQVAYLLRRARELGEQGIRAETPETRSAVYGEFLSLCADCHIMTGGGPAPPRTRAVTAEGGAVDGAAR